MRVVCVWVWPGAGGWRRGGNEGSGGRGVERGDREHWRRKEEKGDELRVHKVRSTVGLGTKSVLGPERTGQHKTGQNRTWCFGHFRVGLLEAQFRRREITSRLSDPGRQQGNNQDEDGGQQQRQQSNSERVSNSVAFQVEVNVSSSRREQNGDA